MSCVNPRVRGLNFKGVNVKYAPGHWNIANRNITTADIVRNTKIFVIFFIFFFSHNQQLNTVEKLKRFNVTRVV